MQRVLELAGRLGDVAPLIDVVVRINHVQIARTDRTGDLTKPNRIEVDARQWRCVSELHYVASARYVLAIDQRLPSASRGIRATRPPKRLAACPVIRRDV